MKSEFFSFNLSLSDPTRFFVCEVIDGGFVARAAGELSAVLRSVDLFHRGSYNFRVITHLLV
jgi:hypothetical protein